MGGQLIGSEPINTLYDQEGDDPTSGWSLTFVTS
jgi:hypothetical protein